ncbi:hypothetical protein QIA34_01740 [Borreliella yangtzensis]|uniref:Uncharacterized protein n=1 Tax=Borreliella yangtzensis TaxID=683292 RepID=A0ABR6P9R7_9SPIR|nr:hypothetical protein [Borreliella yangtzensis]MBB6043007.1 hypothetical protein [Borreliella yangtzensis]WKC73220.1 hypothetical protein QIA35_01745 [Borreliella yangtzensis]WKC74138.1 hypothetical protein QIA34_01740 [Borreliella yangtzensis]
MGRLFLLYFLFSFVFLNLFAQDNSSYVDKQKELAIFYYEVGQRYINVGKVKKGKLFQAKALKIYPDLKKGVNIKLAVKELDARIKDDNSKVVMLEDVKLEEIPGIVHEKIEINDFTNAPKIEYIAQRERSKNQDKIIKFQFGKFARALISQNFDLFGSVIADKVNVMGKFESKDDFISILSSASSKIDPDEREYISVDDYYDLNSLKISKSNDTSFVVNVFTRNNDFTKNFPFWKERQTLIFTKEDDNNWFLSSIK